MLTIDVEFKYNESIERWTFKSNNSGEYLFVNLMHNDLCQISCESGFRSQAVCKKAIRKYLSLNYKHLPRLAYEFRPNQNWEK